MVERVYNIERKFSKLNNHKINTIVWHILRGVLNFCLPIYYKFSKCEEFKLSSEIVSEDVIISFTSFPDRINKIQLTIESLFRQSVRPTRIILWLAKSQFNDINETPNFIKKYEKRGLEVKFCEDLKAHKKYYFTMLENPEAIIITVDDDVIYSERLIEKLLKTYKKYPKCIVCNRAHKMKVNDGTLLSYNQWLMRAPNTKGPSYLLCPTGAGGCLYPPKSLSQHVFDKNILLELCLNADDLWLKCMGYINNTKVVLTDLNNPEVIDVYGTKKNSLARVNIDKNLNDKQIFAVSRYYQIIWNEE